MSDTFKMISRAKDVFYVALNSPPTERYLGILKSQENKF